MAIEFQCVTWHVQDESLSHAYGKRRCYAHCFGKTLKGQSVHVKMPFNAYFFVRGKRTSSFVTELQKRMGVSGREMALRECRIEKHLSFFGFTDNAPIEVTKLSFLSIRAFRDACFHLKQANIQTFESHVDVDLKFLHQTGLRSVGWMRVKTDKVDTNGTFLCKPDDLCNVDNSSAAFAPLVIASYDIEAYSPTNGFPDADKPDDVVYMIGTTFQRFGEDQPYLRHLVTLDSCENMPGHVIEQAGDEGGLVQKWTDVIMQQGTDILVAYNNYGFDDYYMHTRFKKFRPNAPLQLSRIPGVGSHIKKQRSEFAGYSDWRLLVTPGILNLDLHVIIKRDHATLDSYRLDAVAEHFLNERKIDLSPKAMFTKYAEGRGGGNSAGIAEIGRYCIQDTALPLKLLDKLAIIPSMFEMAGATSVPCSSLYQRGASIRVMSMVVKKMHEFSMICPSRVDPRDTYKGSIILEPKIGAYWDPVTVLDFASLYPSIIRRHQLCPSRLVLDDCFANLEGIRYIDIQVDGAVHRFAQAAICLEEADVNCSALQTPNHQPSLLASSITPAIVPALLTELAEFRKRAKNDLARTDNPWQRTLLNAKQKAFKVCMNAVYGAFGAPGPLNCHAVAASVTAIGRQMIDETKRMVEEHFPGSEVVYGDTDSTFIRFEGGIEEAFCRGKEAADMVTKHFGPPVKLELEKVFWPLLLVTKKQYAGLEFIAPDSDPSMKVIGLGAIRRDSCRFVRVISSAILDCLLRERDIQAAKAMARARARQLLRGEVHYSQLIMSSKLGNEYKNDNIAHVQVAKHIAERVAAGHSQKAPPQPGDRVEYLISNVSTNKVYLKARDPEWLMKESKLGIDYDYYFRICFQSKVHGLLLLVDPRCSKLFEDILREHRLKKTKQHAITKFFTLKHG